MRPWYRHHPRSGANVSIVNAHQGALVFNTEDESHQLGINALGDEFIYVAVDCAYAERENQDHRKILILSVAVGCLSAALVLAVILLAVLATW